MILITSVSKEVLLDFVSAVLQNISHVLSHFLHHTEKESRVKRGFSVLTSLTTDILSLIESYSNQMDADVDSSESYLSTNASSLASSSESPTNTSSVPT